MSTHCWIGVDLDGTLAVYDGWKGPLHIGAPIPEMIARVRGWLDKGIVVKIFTARATALHTEVKREDVYAAIRTWCEEHVGQALPITGSKDYGMIAMFDDRAFNVKFNSGEVSNDFEGLPEWAPLATSQ